jgi:oxalate---CoA ligase
MAGVSLALSLLAVKISPYEIEEILLENPNMAEVVVFGLPDRRLGEKLAAAVVLRRPNPAAAAEIIEFAARRLSYLKVPRRVITLDEIPKGPTGKQQRVGLAAKLELVLPHEEHKDQRKNPIREAPTQLEVVLATMWARIIGTERVGLHDNFFEIGGDSLAAMELIEGIEQVTGRSLTIAALFDAPTIRQLATSIEQNDPELQTYVVAIQGAGSLPPFFCVDAGPRYLSLARHLTGAHRPLISIEPSYALRARHGVP